MSKIKRKKISKRKTKTRKNCAPCLAALNPGLKGMRRRNPFDNEDVVRHIYHDKFDDEQYHKKIIDHSIISKNRVNIISKDNKFHIVGVIIKLKDEYALQIKDKYGVVASVVFQLKDILSLDLESATIMLK